LHQASSQTPPASHQATSSSIRRSSCAMSSMSGTVASRCAAVGCGAPPEPADAELIHRDASRPRSSDTSHRPEHHCARRASWARWCAHASFLCSSSQRLPGTSDALPRCHDSCRSRGRACVGSLGLALAQARVRLWCDHRHWRPGDSFHGCAIGSSDPRFLGCRRPWFGSRLGCSRARAGGTSPLRVFLSPVGLIPTRRHASSRVWTSAARNQPRRRSIR